MAFERKLKYGSGHAPELGAIFMCNRATKKMCFSSKTFGLPYTRSSFVKQVKAGMFLFLFEHETRKLYGVYQACNNGTVDFKSAAFSSAGNQYPAQVRFRDLWYCEPLSEDEFRPAIEDNYYTEYKFNFGLSKDQVRALLELFYIRKHGDALEWMYIPPNDSYPTRSASRSPIIDDAGERFDAAVRNQNLLENANSPNQNRELENFSLPNSEVHGRLLIEDDRDHANAVVDTALPNCRRDFSSQGRVIRVRDMIDYGCKPIKDHTLNSGIPYMPKDEGYDPDAPLVNDITAVQQLQRCREEWNERVYTENADDGSPCFKVSEVESITHQFHSSSGMQYAMCDNRIDPLSQYCNSTPNIGNEMAHNVVRQLSYACDVANTQESTKVCEERQSIPPNKRSVFSRLKPALDADEGCKLEDPERSINDMVNDVMETLKGHYCQLVSGSTLAMNEVSDDDDNNSMVKKSQTMQTKYEPPVDLSTAYTNDEALTGGQINRESPRVSFKRRSEVHRTRSAAEGVISSAALEEKHCKRKKLVRPSSGEKKSKKDDMVDKVSENITLSCQPIQDGSINKEAPIPRNEEQNPLEAGSLGSLVLAASVGGSGQSRSSNLTDDIADISMGFDSEKHQTQPFSNPCASDAQHLAKQCNTGSVMRDISIVGKSSQSALNREDSEGAELSLALGLKDQKDAPAILGNTSFGLPPKSALDHVKEMSNNNEFGRSSKDDDLLVDEESIKCSLQVNFMMFSGDRKPGNTVCCEMNGEVERADIADCVSTEMKLGRGQHVYSPRMSDNGSCKLVEFDGGKEELLGQDNVHEDAMSNNLLAEEIPASCQDNEVCYFEFLTK